MITILQGDAIEQLRTLPAESVHCCVTSPPYWGLRDYGTAQWEGGDAACDHRGRSQTSDASTLSEWKNGGGQRYKEETGGMPFAHECGKCGPKRIDSQLGLEKTPEEYVAKMVEVFREVRRVLRKDGTLWLNLGDSYAGGGNGAANYPGDYPKQNSNAGTLTLKGRSGVVPTGLKPKDLCGIPWRVAFALQADGWWLRSDIIWAKPNPMPESVTDRPTKAHEYLFLFAKNSSYFYDAEAIKEQHAPATIERAKYLWCSPDTKASQYQGMNGLNRDEQYPLSESGRNKRSVWTVATAPYPEAHFATYPPDLIKPCIMAGTSAKGCCAKCGSPWERVVERGESSWEARKAAGHKTSGYHVEDGAISSFDTPTVIGRKNEGGLGWVAESKTIGWQPTCDCYKYKSFGLREGEAIPCTVLDPFAGSGTTGAVALELGRKAILIELNPKYVALIKRRTETTMGLALC